MTQYSNAAKSDDNSYSITTPPIPQIQWTMPNITLSAEGGILVAGVLWIVGKQLISSFSVRRLRKMFTPVQEDKRLDQILAQIAGIVGANRVTLATFHNGDIDENGFHLQKISTSNSFTSPGYTLPTPIYNVPIKKLLPTLQPMISADGWLRSDSSDDALPQACREYLLTKGISTLVDRMIFVGYLPVGIISIQFVSRDSAGDFTLAEDKSVEKVNALYEEIVSILKRRIVDPGPVQAIFGKVFGTLSNPS